VVRALIDSASEVLVMTPMLIGRHQWLASDTDRARYEADERLSTLLGEGTHPVELFVGLGPGGGSPGNRRSGEIHRVGGLFIPHPDAHSASAYRCLDVASPY
jgi:hypothetical protein